MPCADQACARTAEHFWLERPIPIAPDYAYWIDPLTLVIRSEAIDYDKPIVRYVATYAVGTLNGDDVLQENFALTD